MDYSIGDPISTWLLSISMPQYVQTFKNKGWTTASKVKQLEKETVKDAGVKEVHIFLLMDAISRLPD